MARSTAPRECPTRTTLAAVVALRALVTKAAISCANTFISAVAFIHSMPVLLPKLGAKTQYPHFWGFGASHVHAL